MDYLEREIIECMSALHPRPERAQLAMLWWRIEHLRPEFEKLIVKFHGRECVLLLRSELQYQPKLRRFLTRLCFRDRGSPIDVLATKLCVLQVAY